MTRRPDVKAAPPPSVAVHTITAGDVRPEKRRAGARVIGTGYDCSAGDSRSRDESARTTRVTKRPDPQQWGDDELMTLREAADLFWPDGPLTETTLRTAVRDGRLPISQIAGKFFVTKTALKSLQVCVTIFNSPSRRIEPYPMPATRKSVSNRDVADLERLRDMKAD